MRLLLVIFLLFALPAYAQEGERDISTPVQAKSVTLRVLNKITARTSIISVKIGSRVKFGNLEIKAHFCEISPPSEPPEAKALLEIWEKTLPRYRTKLEDKPTVIRKTIFTGWMFKSSPALSTLEHPVYDVTVHDCMV